jgi:Domain of unknown function (DUF1707)
VGELRMRAGDADRQRVVAALGRALGEGRLDVAEFDERATRAHAAVYLDELPPLLADLPAEPEPGPKRPGPARWAPRAAVVVALVLVLAWSIVAVAAGAPPVPGLLVLLLFLGHRRRGWGPSDRGPR